MRYPIYRQDSPYSCGAYCIQMILRYHHCKEEIKAIKEKCKLTTQGISIYGMIACLKQYNIEAKAYQCDFDILLDEFKEPCILHTVEDNILHYIVLYKIKKGKCLIGDPGRGLIKIDEYELKQKYSGYCIMIHHVGRYRKDLSYYSFFQFCLDHMKSHRSQIMKVVLFSTLFSLFNIICSFYFQLLIDTMLDQSLFIIFLFTVSFLFITVLRILIQYVRQNYILYVKKQLDQEYVLKPIKNLMYLPIHYFHSNDKATIYTKIEYLSMFSEFFLQLYSILFMDVILMISIFIVLFLLDTSIAEIFFFFVIIMFVITTYYLKKISHLNKEEIQKNQLHHQTLLESLDNIMMTSFFLLKRFMKNKISYFYHELLDITMNKNQLMNSINTLIDTLTQITIFLVIFLCSIQYKSSHLSSGEIILYYMLLSYFITPLFHLIQFWIDKDEIQLIFDQYKEFQSDKAKRKKKLNQKITSITFRNVTYSYGYTTPIFQYCNLTIDSNTIIKGNIGSGKTTLCHLMMGYDKVDKGSIMINQYNINELDLSSLYSRMLYLDKQPVFFHESLRFNLLLEHDELEQEMMYFLHYFGLDDLIMRLEESIDDKGGFLSSGQQQIIMLIRALLRHVDVLILDEAFSNVDQSKVEKIMAYLKQQDIILILVTHQINVVNDDFHCVIIDEDKTVSEVAYAN